MVPNCGAHETQVLRTGVGSLSQGLKCTLNHVWHDSSGQPRRLLRVSGDFPPNVPSLSALRKRFRHWGGQRKEQELWALGPSEPQTHLSCPRHAGSGILVNMVAQLYNLSWCATENIYSMPHRLFLNYVIHIYLTDYNYNWFLLNSESL